MDHSYRPGTFRTLDDSYHVARLTITCHPYDHDGRNSSLSMVRRVQGTNSPWTVEFVHGMSTAGIDGMWRDHATVVCLPSRVTTETVTVVATLPRRSIQSYVLSQRCFWNYYYTLKLIKNKLIQRQHRWNARLICRLPGSTNKSTDWLIVCKRT